MARRKAHSRKRNMKKDEKKGLEQNEAYLKLKEAEKEIDRHEKFKKDYVPKPRAVRKFEKYANMGKKD